MSTDDATPTPPDPGASGGDLPAPAPAAASPPAPPALLAAAPPKPPEPPAPPTLEEQIRALQEALATATAAKEVADGQLSDVQVRLTSLQTLQRDIGRAKEAYESAYDQLTIEDKALVDYHESELESLTDLLCDDVKAVEDLVVERDDALKAATKATTDAEAAVAEAKSDLADYDNTRKACGVELEALQKLAATIKARHTSVKALRDQVTKAHEEGHYALAYWLLAYNRYLEMLGDDPKLIDPDDLPARLQQAVNAKADAEQAFAGGQLALTKREADLAAARLHLADREANGERELRDALKNLTSSKA